MSVYTTEVRFICETEAGLIADRGYNDVDEVIDKSWKKIFKNFPIFDESYREGLCKKILNHYYTREIGAETVALWKFWLNQKMNEIMPYYNKLYMSEQMKYDPLHEVDFTREITENTRGSSTGSSDSSGKQSDTSKYNGSVDDVFKADNKDADSIKISSKTTGASKGSQVNGGSTTTDASSNGQELHSDTPQGSITNLADGKYLTDAKMHSETTNNTVTIDTNSKTEAASLSQIASSEIQDHKHTKLESNLRNEQNSTIDEHLSSNTDTFNKNDTGIKEYIEHVRGKNTGASYSKLIQEYRETLLNIDLDIIFELRDLFMNIY